MARKNPDKAKEAFARLSNDILKYGDEGKEELRDLFEVHRPDVIFKLEQGPERQARAAQLIADMRVSGSELAHAKYHRSKAGRKEKREVVGETAGTYDRFRYVLSELPDGRCMAKITRQARRLREEAGAPPIVAHPRLQKPFTDCAQATLAIRRIINTAMIWYEERGLSPLEKVRKTAGTRASIHRRTSGQVAARERESQERQAEREEERRREKRRSERTAAKVQGRKPKQRQVESSSGRKVTYVPRKNPSNPFSFRLSESQAYRHGVKAHKSYEQWRNKWDQSLREDKPDFSAVLKAYDHIENARANFLIADSREQADKMDEIKRAIRHNLIETLRACRRELSGRRQQVRQANPDPSEHRRIYGKHVSKMEAALDRWSDTGKITCLLDAYKYAELAYAEARNAGDTGMAETLKGRVRTFRDALKRAC